MKDFKSAKHEIHENQKAKGNISYSNILSKSLVTSPKLDLNTSLNSKLKYNRKSSEKHEFRKLYIKNLRKSLEERQVYIYII